MTKFTAFKDDRKATYLNSEGADLPLISSIGTDVLDRARSYRLARLRDQMQAADVDALLLYDPVNIRYAFDSSNMQVWTAHNAIRYALVLSGGPAILFEFKGCEHLANGLPGIDEVRTAISYIFLSHGDKVDGFLRDWAKEISDLLYQYGSQKPRLAVDKLELNAVYALTELGVSVVDGVEIAELSRAIKSPEEIELMRGLF